jgi:hypothetical protein
MEKIFFAKYLAVEGQIKSGEIGISINNVMYTHQPHLPDEYGKPTRLFLCSKDIRVGDTANYFIETIPGMQSLVVTEDNKTSLAVNHGFKILGEVSLEATWVTEGTEFSESEVEEWIGQIQTHHPMLRRLPGDWDEEILKNCPAVFKIKGPCGHFH